MTEAARIHAVPDAGTPAAKPETGSLTASGLPQIIEAATGAGGGVGVAALAGYVVGQVADVAKTYIVETNATERTRIEHGQAGSDPQP